MIKTESLLSFVLRGFFGEFILTFFSVGLFGVLNILLSKLLAQLGRFILELDKFLNTREILLVDFLLKLGKHFVMHDFSEVVWRREGLT